MRILPALMSTLTAAVLGASGYAGGELVRLLDEHPAIGVVHLGAHTHAGRRLGDVHPHLGGEGRVLASNAPDEVPDVDVAFLALPHGASAAPGMALAGRGMRVVDLGSDFRLDSPERYEEAYGARHPAPAELGRWAYGIPELFGTEIAGSATVAAPGCYPTSAVLALAPLLAAGLVEPEGIVVDSASGVTGAGRSPRADLAFGAVAEGIRAYGVLTHRHRPEMEAALGAAAGVEPTVVFVPHLAPMQRGILSTCYARLSGGAGGSDLVEALAKAYDAKPFVRVIDQPPQTRWTVGSNSCLLAAWADARTGTAVVLSAIDNLLKGAAGQALQCANLMLGLDEATGLPVAGWMP